MTSRELRKQRREAERKARKLAYQEGRRQAASDAPEVTFPPNPELLGEFTAEEQAEMMALRARIHARAGLPDSPQSSAAPQSKADPLVRMPVSRLACEAKPGPTGPRTIEGKITSSGNSLKHGLASGRVIIPGEDPAEFEALMQSLLAEHAPVTETEGLLVQQMAQSWWLMQRAIRIQSQALTETCVDTHKLALFLRYQTTHERAFYKALNTLTKLKLSRAPVGAVACPVLEFVSQSRSQDRPAPEFVSQNQVSSGLSGCNYGFPAGILVSEAA